MKNQKIIYAGITILLMLAGVFIGFISNDVILQEEDPNSMIEPLTGLTSQAQQVFPKTDPDQLTSQASSQTSIPEIPIDTWKEGESVKVDYDFASFTLDYSQSDWVDASTNNPPSPKRLLDKLGNALVDDGNDAYLQFISDQESTTHRDIFRWVIPISENVPRTGTIYLESEVSFTQYILSITHVSYYFLRNDGLGHTVHSLDVVSPYTTKDITLDIADYIQEDGKIYGKISIQYNTDSNNNDHKLFVSLDHFCYSPDSVTEHVRSEYLYSSGGVISHQLDFWNPSSSDIEIFLPLNWDSIEISPVIDYSLDSDNTMEILGVPGNTFFTLRASQNSSKQYLAISTEKTYDMEGELPDHDLIASSTTYDGDYGISEGWSQTNYKGDNTLNSTIVSNGAYSLRMDGNLDSPNYRAYLGFYVPYGEYYFSFDYYVESSDGAILIFAFYMAGSGTVVSALTLDQTANRWHKGFVFGNCKYTYYSQAVIAVRDTSDFVVFFDNIQFLKVNHQQETIDYSQTLFSGQLNSWTSKGLIPLPFEEINLELRDRTGDSSIKAIETMTDSQGFFSWIFQGKLLEKEYEFRSWSWDSWFGLYSYEYFEDLTYFSADSTTSYSESIDSDVWQTGDSSFKGEIGDDDSYNALKLDPPNFDGSNLDYLIYDVKANKSLTDSYITFFHTGSDYWNFLPDYTYTTSWIQYYIDFSDIYNTIGNPTWDSVISWYWIITTSDYTIWMDSIRFIQAQKSYFTPLTTGSIDYAMKQQEDNPNDFDSYWGFDGWDWAEGSDDYDGSGWWVGGSGAVENGYLRWNPSTSRFYSYITFTTNIDSSFYEYFIVRVKTNHTVADQIYFEIVAGARIGSVVVLGSNEWTIAEIIGAGDSDWSGTETSIKCQFYNSTNEVFDGNTAVYIDIVRCVHRDSNLESGYSWEFNEDFEAGDNNVPLKDGWRDASGTALGTMVVKNGYLEFGDTIGGSYARIRTFDYLNWNDITGMVLRVKVDTIVDTPRFNVGQEGGSISAYQYVYTYWKTFVFEFSWTGNYPMRLALDQNAGVWSVDITCQVEFIRWIIDSPPNLYETQTDFLLENEGFLNYITFTDSIFSGYYANMDFIGKNMSIGSHSFVYSAYYDYLSSGVTLPSAFYQYDYDIDETGIMKVIIHDQSGNVIPFDSMEVYIDSTRLFDNYIYFSDVSQTFNLTITDLFENMLYQDTTEDFENFKEIQITLHSVKIQNLQENPIWVQITRDSKNYSEWIYSYEIIEYRLEAATYGFTVYYCDSLAGDIGALSTNGSWVYLEYAVSADSAIMITGETIQDVFNNVISLTQDLTDVNASLSNQIIDVDIHVSNVNTSITNQVVSVEIFLDNVNTTIGTQLLSIETDINNVNTTLYAQTVSILTQIANTNSTLYAQDLQIISDIQNVNATLYAQDMTILTNISNTNSTLHAQNIAILQDLAELKGIYRVHFSVIDGAGIGLPFETVLLNVNGSRHFDQDVYLSNNTYFEAEAFDWFDVSLWSDSFSITKQTEVNISIQLYWVLFENNGSYTSYLEIWRNNKLGVNITVAPDQTVSIRLTEGVYDYRVYYFKNDSQETTTKDPSIYSYGKSLLSLGKFAVSALMPTKINVSTPKIKLPLLEAILEQLTLVEIIANVVLTVLGLAASYFVLNFIVRRAIGRHAQDPSYVPPRERDDWLDKLEKKAGLNTDDEGLW